MKLLAVIILISVSSSLFCSSATIGHRVPRAGVNDRESQGLTAHHRSARVARDLDNWLPPCVANFLRVIQEWASYLSEFDTNGKNFAAFRGKIINNGVVHSG